MERTVRISLVLAAASWLSVAGCGQVPVEGPGVLDDERARNALARVCNTPDACGASCSVCPSDPRGDATCSGSTEPSSKACSIECHVGHVMTMDGCLPCDWEDACGSDCLPCPAAANGQAACGGNTEPAAQACGIACDAGYTNDGAGCAACRSANRCGSDCQPCPVSQYGPASCAGNTEPAAQACQEQYRPTDGGRPAPRGAP
jgi:hypothetical protein